MFGPRPFVMPVGREEEQRAHGTVLSAVFLKGRWSITQERGEAQAVPL